MNPAGQADPEHSPATSDAPDGPADRDAPSRQPGPATRPDAGAPEASTPRDSQAGPADSDEFEPL